ncbi:sporulation sigma-E factor-processing peptidase [Bacillus sp. J14TS2]|uniref:sigma-E processing peptidase SpoIIGA n=1 Tax=Bacillus sp. J14TS2 TaxID=2807188 RepID=UPI001B23504F|nr:sigma-E processing peptidase SpoIIGA [Bacillus sp. J14TS2]GIN74365.1 sporulation sigma-E factor-processing peptidase [Bacillus sp. J14TS2]
MVVYLDIIWLLNFIIDSFLLWATSIYLKRKIHPFKIIIGGLIGSLIILMAATPISTWAMHPFIKWSLSIVMIGITFGYKRLSTFVASLFTFYFATFLMGGILIGTHYFLSFHLDLRNSVAIESVRGYGDPISWLFVAVAFPIAWFFSKKRIGHLTKTSIQYDVLYDVFILMNGIELKLKGLIDSGNQLYDPISKKPVMIVSIESVKDKLPEELQNIADAQDDLYTASTLLPTDWAHIMRLIPAKTLGKNNQLLCAFKPEKVVIQEESGREIEKEVLLVFTSQLLSGDGTFQCILHPQMAPSLAMDSAS